LGLEHFRKSCSDELKLVDSGLFGFGFRLRQGYGGTGRFSSVTGFSNLLRRPSLAKNQKSLLHTAPSSVNALV
jgi:hypothetical protein